MTPPAGGALVLVADDDEDMLELASLHLREAGYDVTKARDGVEALRLARERHPDLCVFDAVMPGLRGHEVLRALREDEGTEAIPVVLVTATLAELSPWRLGPKPDDCLGKTSMLELGARVDALLEGVTGERASVGRA
jgi:CheY-like chemotaxis protein